jgi:hypothetical protein
MKLEATIVVSYRADSLAEAGDKLDDILRRAREREDIEVENIQLNTPVTAGPVSLPRVESPPPPPRRVPHPLPNGRG